MSMIKDNIKNILKDIKDRKDFFKHNHKIFQCMKGNQLDVLRQEFSSMMEDSEMADAKTKLAVSLNYIQSITNKLSTLYSNDVTRTATSDQQLVDFYIKNLDLDQMMQEGNEYFNGLKSTLFEVYQRTNKSLGVRSYANDRFHVYSTDPIEPNVPNIFIKFLGLTDSQKGKRQAKVEKYIAYSDEEWVEFDADGIVLNEGENFLGRAPFVYVNRDRADIVPVSNKDLLQAVISIASLLSDAATAAYYQSFPTKVLINTDIDKADINANVNTVMVLNSKPGSSATPDFKVVASTLDLSQALNLAMKIKNELLETLDIKSSGAESNAESGIAMALKNTDTVDNKKIQQGFFVKAERELWEIIILYHNSIVRRNNASVKTPKTTFSEDCEVETSFELPDTAVQQIAAANGEDMSKEVNKATESADKKEDTKADKEEETKEE